jgi:hypothetical protein
MDLDASQRRLWGSALLRRLGRSPHGESAKSGNPYAAPKVAVIESRGTCSSERQPRSGIRTKGIRLRVGMDWQTTSHDRQPDGDGHPVGDHPVLTRLDIQDGWWPALSRRNPSLC